MNTKVKNQTKVKVEHNHDGIPKGRVPLPVGMMKVFIDNVLPTWQAKIFSAKDSWPNIDDHLNKLQFVWDKYLGHNYPHKINKSTEAYHKVSQL